MNDNVFVAKGYGHIWASSGHRLKRAFCGCLNDVEAHAYVRTASYAPWYVRYVRRSLAAVGVRRSTNPSATTTDVMLLQFE